MEQQALGATEMRVIIFIIGLIALALIYLFGRPKKPGQGKRTLFRKPAGERVEPTFEGDVELDDTLDSTLHGEQLELLGSNEVPFESIAVETRGKGRTRRPTRPLVGVRPDSPIERIVTLFVCARAGLLISGSDLVVAAEKSGLEFGDQGIFHRMVTGKSESGPIFSMANMVKPGSFDMTTIEQLETPGLTLFMALPGPLSALDAWDTLLPTAQRLAELLDASLLDEKRGALGRQGIAHVRDELRAWDRKQEGGQIRPSW
ncbi:MAG TPA: cell division protein ZipA [Dokdonella sp.]|uniref:cell division protein ZipA n=1 Tax=Dokdonella sp. TaxID=2291710 RepID=UPI002BC70F1D|nr:cell division protein ZipA [Dokdonella sp.]HOX71608.1 cell division protein ZipA [Dokdonella sp.]HPG94188.1 cell division protein ZipA [Dokdonella sp.]HPN80583.1 cell division protein ZipA [Dokdonella sp.]